MVLDFACPCGAALRVSESDAGLPVCCPACSRDVTAPGDPLRPGNRHQRGTLLDNTDPGALPLNESENPLAFVGPGEMARERDRAVRASEEAEWFETPNHRKPKAKSKSHVLGLLIMAVSLVGGLGWIFLIGPSKSIANGTTAMIIVGASLWLRGSSSPKPQQKR